MASDCRTRNRINVEYGQYGFQQFHIQLVSSVSWSRGIRLSTLDSHYVEEFSGCLHKATLYSNVVGRLAIQFQFIIQRRPLGTSWNIRQPSYIRTSSQLRDVGSLYYTPHSEASAPLSERFLEWLANSLLKLFSMYAQEIIRKIILIARSVTCPLFPYGRGGMGAEREAPRFEVKDPKPQKSKEFSHRSISVRLN